MGNYRIHISFYLLIAAAYSMFIRADMVLLVLGLSTGAVYSILPDIDTGKSYIGRRLRKILFLTLALSLSGFILIKEERLLTLSLILSLILLMLLLTRHRGFFHTTPAAFLMSLPAYLLMKELLPFALIGYVSHLILDRVTLPCLFR